MGRGVLRLAGRVSVLWLVFLLFISTLGVGAANASIYGYDIGSSSATVQSPSVILQNGNAGTSTISSPAPDAATAALSAGLTFYENASAPSATLALDGSATGVSTGSGPHLVQQTSKECSGATTCSQGFSSSVTSGDILVVSLETATAISSLSISDSRCSSWTAASGSGITDTAEANMWYCTAGSSGADSPSVSWTTSVNAKLDIYEISGYTSTGLTCGTGTSGTTTLATSNVAFSTPAFLVAAWALSSRPFTAGTGFTASDTSSSGDGGSGEYNTSTITSPTTFPATRGGGSAQAAGVGCEFPAASSTGSSLTASAILTTTGTSDVIYVMVGILNSGSQTVQSVTDNYSHTYSPRAGVSFGTNVRIETWYAVATSAMAADNITVTLTSPANFVFIAKGISGTDTASPFDPNLATPPSNTGTGTSASTTVTTTFPTDFLIGAVVSQNAPTLAAGTGFVNLTSVATSAGTVTGGAESQLVTSVQSGSSVAFGLSTSQNWAIIADAIVAGKSSATVDTSVSTPGSSGSLTLGANWSAFLWSPAYTAGGTLYSGGWLLDLWASDTVSGTLSASILVVNSTNGVTGTALSSGATASIPTTETEVKTTLSASGATIPTNGEILLVLTNPGAGTATIYWGTGQLTNFATPGAYNYVLAVNNTTSTSWSISLGTMASMTSNLGRLANLTVWFTSPFSDQIIVLNGALSQSSGSAVTLPAGPYTAVDIAVAAMANAVPTSSNSPSVVVFSLKVVSATGIYAQYTISLSVT